MVTFLVIPVLAAGVFSFEARAQYSFELDQPSFHEVRFLANSAEELATQTEIANLQVRRKRADAVCAGKFPGMKATYSAAEVAEISDTGNGLGAFLIDPIFFAGEDYSEPRLYPLSAGFHATQFSVISCRAPESAPTH